MSTLHISTLPRLLECKESAQKQNGRFLLEPRLDFSMSWQTLDVPGAQVRTVESGVPSNCKSRDVCNHIGDVRLENPERLEKTDAMSTLFLSG